MKCCGVSAPEERGPVDGVEGEEDDGEGHPGQPLYVTVPHPAQPSGGAGLHLPCTWSWNDASASQFHI